MDEENRDAARAVGFLPPPDHDDWELEVPIDHDVSQSSRSYLASGAWSTPALDRVGLAPVPFRSSETQAAARPLDGVMESLWNRLLKKPWLGRGCKMHNNCMTYHDSLMIA